MAAARRRLAPWVLGAAVGLMAPAFLGGDLIRSASAAARPFHGQDVTGADYGRDFMLLDHQGKPRTLADFRGKVVLVVFSAIPIAPTSVPPNWRVSRLSCPS